MIICMTYVYSWGAFLGGALRRMPPHRQIGAGGQSNHLHYPDQCTRVVAPCWHSHAEWRVVQRAHNPAGRRAGGAPWRPGAGPRGGRLIDGCSGNVYVMSETTLAILDVAARTWTTSTGPTVTGSAPLQFYPVVILLGP